MSGLLALQTKINIQIRGKKHDWINRRRINDIGIFAAGDQSFTDKGHKGHFAGHVSYVSDRYLFVDGARIQDWRYGAFHRKCRHFLFGLDHFDLKIEV